MTDNAIRIRIIGWHKVKKKGQDRNPAPFLNPISYEKPSMLIQPPCRNPCQDPGVQKTFLPK
jgi:hypothetical protein